MKRILSSLFIPFRRAARTAGDERGQSYLEFILIFPALVALLLFIGAFGWYWWNQTTAATAIHDGTYWAAIRGSSMGRGYAETRRALQAALGGVAQEYEGRFILRRYPQYRSTWGVIRNDRVIALPFLGDTLFQVRAMSFQRTERFYGGPPEDWE